MDINLLKSLSEELTELTKELQKRSNAHLLTDKEFLEFVKNISGKNSLILKEIDSHAQH